MEIDESVMQDLATCCGTEIPPQRVVDVYRKARKGADRLGLGPFSPQQLVMLCVAGGGIQDTAVVTPKALQDDDDDPRPAKATKKKAAELAAAE